MDTSPDTPSGHQSEVAEAALGTSEFAQDTAGEHNLDASDTLATPTIAHVGEVALGESYTETSEGGEIPLDQPSESDAATSALIGRGALALDNLPTNEMPPSEERAEIAEPRQRPIIRSKEQLEEIVGKPLDDTRFLMPLEIVVEAPEGKRRVSLRHVHPPYAALCGLLSEVPDCAISYSVAQELIEGLKITTFFESMSGKRTPTRLMKGIVHTAPDPEDQKKSCVYLDIQTELPEHESITIADTSEPLGISMRTEVQAERELYFMDELSVKDRLVSLADFDLRERFVLANIVTRPGHPWSQAELQEVASGFLETYAARQQFIYRLTQRLKTYEGDLKNELHILPDPRRDKPGPKSPLLVFAPNRREANIYLDYFLDGLTPYQATVEINKQKRAALVSMLETHKDHPKVRRALRLYQNSPALFATGNTIRDYLNTAGSYPLLEDSDAQELHGTMNKGLELYQAQEAGQPEVDQQETYLEAVIAHEKLYYSSMGIVVSVAKDYRGRGVDFEDLIQEGNVGLLTAIARFDASKDTKFSTFAYQVVERDIRRATVNQGRTIRLPVDKHKEVQNMKATEAILKQGLGRDPTEEEVAEELGITLQEARELKRVKDAPDSLDTPKTSREQGDKYTHISHVQTVEGHLDDIHEALRSHQRIQELLRHLDPRERAVVGLSLGLELDDMPGYGDRFHEAGKAALELKDIGELLGMTSRKTGRVLRAALEKLNTVISART